MKELLGIILSAIGAAAFFFLSGKNSESNKRIKEENENTKKNIKIIKDASNRSYADKYESLFSRQKNGSNK